MIGLGFLFALANLSANDMPRSPLVEPNHVHEWEQVVLDDESIVWFDGANIPDLEFETGFYPVVLLRGIAIEDDRIKRTMDMKLAVDCEGSKLAPLDAWFQETADGTQARETPQSVRFRSPARFPPELGKPVFDRACGPDTKNPFDL